MKPETRKLLDKASRALRAAETLLDSGDADFAIGRAYYAMFYVAEALLHENDRHSRKHSGVIAMFGETFAKTGAMDAIFHRRLLDAYDQRILADYGVDAVLTREDAAKLIIQTREFLEAASRFLKP